MTHLKVGCHGRSRGRRDKQQVTAGWIDGEPPTRHGAAQFQLRLFCEQPLLMQHAEPLHLHDAPATVE